MDSPSEAPAPRPAPQEAQRAEKQEKIEKTSQELAKAREALPTAASLAWRLEIARKIVGESATQKDLDAFLADPTLRHLGDIHTAWLRDPKSKNNPSVLTASEAKTAARAVRTLAFQDKPVNEQNFKEALLQIQATREDVHSVPLFKGRNLVFVAHDQMIRDAKPSFPLTEDLVKQYERESGDKYVYGKSALRKALLAQQGKAVGPAPIFTREAHRGKALERQKEGILRDIATSPPKSTFVFHGHGNMSKLFFATVPDGQVDYGSYSISYRDLADALRARAKNFPQLRDANPSEGDVLVFAHCFNANFIHNLDMALGKDPMPICVGSAEFGQPDYSQLNKPIDPFFRDILQVQSKKPTTIGTIIDYEFDPKTLATNPSIYVRPRGKKTLQVVEDETRVRPKKTAA